MIITLSQVDRVPTIRFNQQLVLEQRDFAFNVWNDSNTNKYGVELPTYHYGIDNTPMKSPITFIAKQSCVAICNQTDLAISPIIDGGIGFCHIEVKLNGARISNPAYIFMNKGDVLVMQINKDQYPTYEPSYFYMQPHPPYFNDDDTVNTDWLESHYDVLKPSYSEGVRTYQLYMSLQVFAYN